MIRIDRPFFLYANASIKYSGRAKSTLKTGNYIIIHKGDGTLLIHGDSKTTPLNYQRPKSVMTIKGREILSINDNEIIKIYLFHIIHHCEMPEWSSNIIKIKMTENDLRDKIIKNIDNYIDDPVNEIIKEFKTPYGPVDIVVVSSPIVPLVTKMNLYHIIEVKRGKANINTCTQLCRYLGYFDECKIMNTGWIMSPEITKGAINYCSKKNLQWIRVEH